MDNKTELILIIVKKITEIMTPNGYQLIINDKYVFENLAGINFKTTDKGKILTVNFNITDIEATKNTKFIPIAVNKVIQITEANGIKLIINDKYIFGRVEHVEIKMSHLAKNLSASFIVTNATAEELILEDLSLYSSTSAKSIGFVPEDSNGVICQDEESVLNKNERW